MVDIMINAEQMKKLQATCGRLKNGVPRALTPAINRALASGQTTVRRQIRQTYLIKQKDIPTKVTRATYGKPSGDVTIRQTMLDLSKFKFSGGTGKRPLFARVKKGGGGTIKRGFVRYGIPFRRLTEDRLPIRKILTIGAPIMASQPEVGEEVNRVMGDTLAKRIDHEIERVMATAGGAT